MDVFKSKWNTLWKMGDTMKISINVVLCAEGENLGHISDDLKARFKIVDIEIFDPLQMNGTTILVVHPKEKVNG